MSQTAQAAHCSSWPRLQAGVEQILDGAFEAPPAARLGKLTYWLVMGRAVDSAPASEPFSVRGRRWLQQLAPGFRQIATVQGATEFTLLEKPPCNVVFRWVWNMDDVQDVVQDAFVRLWRMRARVDLVTVEPLIYKIALNLAASRRRSKKIWRWVSLDVLCDPVSTKRPADESLAAPAGRGGSTLLVGLLTWAGVDWRGQRDTLPAEFDLVQVSLGLSAAPSEPLTISVAQRTHTAARRVPLPTDQVVLYLIGSIQD